MAKTLDELKEAYLEVIDVMDLKETVKGKKVPLTIPDDVDEDYLKEKLILAIGMIEEGDKFTDETQEVFDELDVPEEMEEVKPVRGGKAKAAKPAKEEAKEDDAPAEKKPKGKKPEKAGEPGKPGIIATIVSLIEGAGKKGISKQAILKELQADFPGRDEKSMKNTINVQVPARIRKERFELVKLENGNFAKA